MSRYSHPTKCEVTVSPFRKFPLKSTVALAAAALALASLSGCSSAASTVHGKTTLTIATPQAPTSLDPSIGSGGQLTLFQDTAYQSLFHTVGNTGVAPSLASGYTWVGTGNTTLKVTLRPGIKFSDGTDLDSAAVKNWIAYFKKQDGAHAYAAATIASIDTPNKLTVVFHLSAPTPQLPANLAETTGMGAIGSPKALQDGAKLDQTTDGAGPFVLSTKATVQGSTYTYVPNPHYYDSKAIDFNKVVIKVIANANTAYDALRSGQVNISWGDSANYKAAKAAGLNEAAFPINLVGMWTSDPKGEIVPALGNIHVRQALQYAINRSAIAKVAAPNGTGEGTVQPVTPDSVGYNKSLESQYPYDPAKAKSLLAEAGYPNGFPMTISVAPAGGSELVVAQAIASQLAKVGVTVTLRTPATFNEWVQDVFTGKYEVVIGLGLNGMPTTMDNLFNSPALLNYRNASYPDLISLAHTAAGLGGNAAEKAWEAVNAKEVKDAYELPVVDTSSIYYWNSSVKGVDGSSLLNPAYITSSN